MNIKRRVQFLAACVIASGAALLLGAPGVATAGTCPGFSMCENTAICPTVATSVCTAHTPPGCTFQGSVCFNDTTCRPFGEVDLLCAYH